jgi:hypothetical protein
VSMGKGAWERTPYAKSDAKDPDKGIMNLLDKYNITDRQWTQHKGPNGRPACTLAFIVGGKTYRIMVETLDVTGVDKDQLIKQVKRVIFWTLKPLIENAIVFGPAGLQRLLLPFIVDNQGVTVYERLQPHLNDVKAQELISVGHQLALPAPEQV